MCKIHSGLNLSVIGQHSVTIKLLQEANAQERGKVYMMDIIPYVLGGAVGCTNKMVSLIIMRMS